ncbi:MAG: RNA polymerase sigma factor RpoD/SigA [Bilifractor sp.]
MEKESNKESMIEKQLTESLAELNEENAELCRRIQKGDTSAQEELIEKNRKLVDKYAWSYHKYYGNDLDFEDIENMGLTGLLHAAEKFDPAKGAAFSTYATFWIRQSIVRGIMESGFSVRIPVHVFAAVSKASAINSRLSSEGVDDPDKRTEMVAKEMKIPVEKAAYYLSLKQDFFTMPSLNNPVGEDGETELGDMVSDGDTESVEDAVVQSDLYDRLDEIVGTLSEREQYVIKRRFGLDGQEVQTLDEIGKQLGVTRERVRQIEAKAIRKLRAPKTMLQLKDAE